MKRIVSLTPLAVEKDSRTFKQAASMSRLGYESIVVEGVPSALDRSRLPFELRTAHAETAAEGQAGALALKERLVRRATGTLKSLGSRYANALYEAWMFLWANGPKTARSVPPASLYYLHSTPQYAAVRLRSRRRVPFIWDAHDYYAADWDGSKPILHRVLRGIERRCMRDAAAVITTSEGYAELFHEHYGRRPVVLPNVHDPRIDEAPPRDLRATLGLAADDFLVVMVGNAKEGTAVEEALESMSMLPQSTHLAFVGNRWAPYRDRIAARGLDRRVHLVEPVPPSQVAPFIASADLAAILYFPLTVDYLHALPNRLFIPVSAGLPLLYPHSLTELERLAEEHGFGIPFDSRSPQSFADAVGSLVADRTLLARHREAAARAGEALRWEREETRLAAIVERAIAGGARAGARYADRHPVEEARRPG